MEHAQFIKMLSRKRGAKTEYAKRIGISTSFLRQIETQVAVTPKRIYSNVIEATGGKVQLDELVNEHLKIKKVRES